MASKLALNSAKYYLSSKIAISCSLYCNLDDCSSGNAQLEVKHGGSSKWTLLNVGMHKIELNPDQYKLLKPGFGWPIIYPERNSIGEFRYSIIQIHSTTLDGLWISVCARSTNMDRETAASHPLLDLIWKPNPISTWYLHKQNWIHCLPLILQRSSSSMAHWSCQSFNLMPSPATECNFGKEFSAHITGWIESFWDWKVG